MSGRDTYATAAETRSLINLLTLIALAFVGLTLGELAALLCILLGYAIPRAPNTFRIALTIPMTILALTAFATALAALYGDDFTILGLSGLPLFTIHMLAELLTWWILVGYAVYHQLFGTHRCTG